MTTPIIIAGPKTPLTGGGGVASGGQAAGEASAFSALLDLLTSGVFSQGKDGNFTGAIEGTANPLPGQNPVPGIETGVAGEATQAQNTVSIETPAPTDDPLADLLSELDALIGDLTGSNLSGAELDAALASLEELAARLQELGTQLASEPQLIQAVSVKLNELQTAQNLSASAGEKLQPILDQMQAALQTARTAQQTANPAGGEQTPETADLRPAVDQPRTSSNQSTGADHRVQTAAQQGAETGQSGTNTGGDRGNNSNPQPALLAAGVAARSAGAADDAKPGTDPVLPVQSGQTARLETTATFRPALAAYGQNGQVLNVPQIGLEIARQVQNGLSRFQIQLNPPELGRIDVRMDMDNNGSLNARLTVDRAETLDMLQRDARALERALSQAGLDGSRTNLEFALRQDTQDGRNGQAGDDFAEIFEGGVDADDSGADAPPIIQYRGALSPGSISLWV